MTVDAAAAAGWPSGGSLMHAAQRLSIWMHCQLLADVLPMNRPWKAVHAARLGARAQR